MIIHDKNELCMKDKYLAINIFEMSFMSIKLLKIILENCTNFLKLTIFCRQIEVVDPNYDRQISGISQ